MYCLISDCDLSRYPSGFKEFVSHTVEIVAVGKEPDYKDPSYARKDVTRYPWLLFAPDPLFLRVLRTYIVSMETRASLAGFMKKYIEAPGENERTLVVWEAQENGLLDLNPEDEGFVVGASGFLDFMAPISDVSEFLEGFFLRDSVTECTVLYPDILPYFRKSREMGIYLASDYFFTLEY